MKKIAIFFMCIMVLTMNSCALMFNGSSKRVTVNTMTEDAKIYVDGNLVGNGTYSDKLRRKDDHIIMAKKPGCETRTAQINSEWSAGWLVFDFLFNWLAFLTDCPTGAAKSFDKSNVVLDMSNCEDVQR